MKTLTTDVAIIGSGTAGLNALREVEKAGLSWLLIESGEYGTMCARTGCMPSKLLIAAAEVSHTIDHADVFGIHAKDKTINAQSVFERVRSERDRFAGFVVKSTQARPEEFRIKGHAKFIDNNTLQVDDHTIINAQSIVIATGSEPFIPPAFNKIKDDLLINDDVFELQEFPRTLAVIGTGIIGLELGQSLHRLGVETTFFSRSDQLSALTDPVVHSKAREVLSKELNFVFNSNITHADKSSSGIHLKWRDANDTEHSQLFDKILISTGRKSTLQHLNLEAVGLTNEQVRQEWNEQTAQVGDLPIFVAGDAAGHRQILHEASDEGRIAGKNAALYPNTIAQVRRTPLAITFTDPQMALVGKTYSELQPKNIEVGEASYDDQGRARVMNQHRGIIRIYANKTDCTLVGAELFSPRAENLAHLLAWAVQQKMTIQQALEMPVYHPVLEEGVRTALRDVMNKLKLTGNCRSIDLADAPGE
ncbi:MAG: dihydrolipoyl dehydrogenase [Gammaproteobacteria bacterium]|nr:MAG: dihydrolipoyl dehydrogenase [Gammaproteobacteria bacterium]